VPTPHFERHGLPFDWPSFLNKFESPFQAMNRIAKWTVSATGWPDVGTNGR